MNIETIIDRALKMPMTENEKMKLGDMCIYNNYAEPGYDNDQDCIILGDYNPDDFDNGGNFERACNLLEKRANLEWSDEWAPCQECGKLVRVSGNCYGWTPYYHIFNDDDFACGDCIQESYKQDYIDDLTNDPKRAIMLDNIDPLDFGFREYNGVYENGFYPGQNDTPDKVVALLKSQGIENYIFSIIGAGQFDLHFRVYVK